MTKQTEERFDKCDNCKKTGQRCFCDVEELKNQIQKGEGKK